MSKLLSKQRKITAIVFLLEALSLLTFILCFVFVTNEYYVEIGIALLAFFILIDTTLLLYFNHQVDKNKAKSELKASAIIGNDIEEAYQFGELGLAVTDHDNIVIWMNGFLNSRFQQLVDENIYKEYPALLSLSDPSHNAQSEHPRIVKDNRTYEVELISEAHLFIFKDITDFANVYAYNQKQSPVVGYIAIDNFSDIQMYMEDDFKFTEMQTIVNQMIADFASDNNALLRKIRDDRYIFVTTKEFYEKMYSEKFPLVDSISKRFTNGFTISIGISLGFPDYAKLASMASNALDVALSRGGDQIVVDNHGQPLAYFGGKRDLMPSRNKVKTRTLSNSFLTILKNYRDVVVMGHKTADFDAIASCLAVYLLAKTAGVNCKICWEVQLVEDKCRRAVECEFTKEEMEDYFISMKEVDSYINEKTLLVLVDHSNPLISIFSANVNKFPHIAVIDHHRPGNMIVSDPVFENVDTSASSASEILTSFLMYNASDIQVDERTATFLLAGICLDTHFYHEHATNSTFEASGQLKNWNADTLKVVDFLKEDLEEFKQKISILDNSETPFTGIYVTISPDEDIVPEITLSQVADEGLSVRGIFASFCIGRITPHTVKVSARSDGSFNVGTIMENMGGGGRFTMAAGSYDDCKVEEVKARLIKVLNDYAEDAKIH